MAKKINQTHNGLENVRLLVSALRDEIAIARAQTWRIANYTLLLIAALLGARHLLGSPRKYEDIACSVLIAILAVLNTCFQWHCFKTIKDIRIRLDEVLKRFPEEDQQLWMAGKENAHRGVEVTILLIGVGLIAAFIAIYLVCRS